MLHRATAAALGTALLAFFFALPLTAAAQQERLKPMPCTRSPLVLPERAGQPAATPLPAEEAGFIADSWVTDPEQLPAGEAASPEIAAEITTVLQEMVGCWNAGDGALVAATMSENALAHLGGADAVIATLNDQAERDPRTTPWLRVGDVRVLPNGRVGAVLTTGLRYGDGARGAPQTIFMVLVRDGDQWLFDGQINGNVDESYAVLSPDDSTASADGASPGPAAAPNGYAEVDSALYAEPTLAGATLSIEAHLMVGLLDGDDSRGVASSLFVIERGATTATVTAMCQARPELAGRAAYLSASASGLATATISQSFRCEYAAPLAEFVVFSCTLPLPASGT